MYATWCGYNTPYALNWGDALTPWLIEKITGKRPEYGPGTDDDPSYIVTGSILSWATPTHIVWGAGFIAQERRLQHWPKRICAVRGPLSWEKVVASGYSCPKVFGDPGLLAPRYYSPPVARKTHVLGVVPHYIDQHHPWVAEMSRIWGVQIIDIMGGIEHVMDEVASCRMIVSSTLHGLVVADALDVPNLWIELSDQVMGKGFKFRDYFAGVHRTQNEPVQVTHETDLLALHDALHDYAEKPEIDLDRLMGACPL